MQKDECDSKLVTGWGLLYNLHNVYKYLTRVDGLSKSVIHNVFLTSPFRPLSAVQRLMSYKPNKCFILALSLSDLECRL